MRFSDLSRETKGATLDLGGGDTIDFRFRHQAITPRMMHDLLAWEHAGEGTTEQQVEAVMELAGFVARLVTVWDVMEDDGETMFPLEAARLAEIPAVVLMRVIQTMFAGMQSAGEAQAPGEDISLSKPASGATSSRTVRLVRRRTGTR